MVKLEEQLDSVDLGSRVVNVAVCHYDWSIVGDSRIVRRANGGGKLRC